VIKPLVLPKAGENKLVQALHNVGYYFPAGQVRPAGMVHHAKRAVGLHKRIYAFADSVHEESVSKFLPEIKIVLTITEANSTYSVTVKTDRRGRCATSST